MGQSTRIEAVDLARGFAVTLMILSHGVKGLLSFDQFPIWGLIPLHLITKFSSTIFFLVFGIALAVAFAPATKNAETWRDRRNKLFLRGLAILFWYKILTVIEMFQLHSREQIIDALMYRSFPSYAEILDFYALALLWIPFALPYWQRSSQTVKAVLPFVFVLLAMLLTRYFDFWGSRSLKAILVEEDGFYTWGQITRVSVVCLGLFIGGYLRENYFDLKKRLVLSGILALAAAALFVIFISLSGNQLFETLHSLALNEGKHPPDIFFILFSLSGALAVLAFSFLVGERGAKFLSPVTLIGKDTLAAFIFHLSVLFVVYRYLFDLRQKVTYPQALALTVLLILMTAIWIKLKIWRKHYEAARIPPWRKSDTRELGVVGTATG